MVKYIIVIYGYKYGFFQVDDGEYFQTLPENSVFIFLRSGEIWRPEGTDAVRAGKQKKMSQIDNYQIIITHQIS